MYIVCIYIYVYMCILYLYVYMCILYVYVYMCILYTCIYVYMCIQYSNESVAVVAGTNCVACKVESERQTKGHIGTQ